MMELKEAIEHVRINTDKSHFDIQGPGEDEMMKYFNALSLVLSAAEKQMVDGPKVECYEAIIPELNKRYLDYEEDAEKWRAQEWWDSVGFIERLKYIDPSVHGDYRCIMVGAYRAYRKAQEGK